MSFSTTDLSETPINTGVPKGAEYCAILGEYFQILTEYFQILKPY